MQHSPELGNEPDLRAEIAALRKELDTARLREAMWRNLYREAPHGLCYLDRQLRFVDVNEWVSERSGLSVDAHLGLTIAEVCAKVDVAAANGCLIEEQLRRVLATGRPSGPISMWQETALHPGQKRLYEHNYYPYPPAGEPIGVRCIVQDITERYRGEMEILRLDGNLHIFRELARNLPIGILIFEVDIDNPEQSRLLFRNEIARSLGRNLSDEEVVGQPLSQRFAVVLQTKGPEALAEVARSGKPLYLPEFVYPGDENIPRMLLRATLSPLSHNRVCAVLEDLTAQRKAEEDRADLQSRLERSQRMELIAQIAGGVAHDMNNLLMGVSGLADIALSRLDRNHAAYSCVDEIKRSAQSGASVPKRLLSFSRKSKAPTEVAPLNLNDAVRDEVAVLKRLLGDNIHLQLELAAESALVCVDPGQFEQILMNLAINARDAMPEGGTITFRTDNISLSEEQARGLGNISPGEHLILTVSDSGKGMDEETQKHVFEPYFTTKEDGKGTGLGLFSVYGIVRQYGGHIEFTSKPQEGTSFSICLPRCEQEPQVAAASSETTADLEKARIVLVEDQPYVRMAIEHYLTKAGYAVQAFNDAEDALSRIQQSSTVDLVVSDVMLPGVSGPELVTKLRSHSKGLKVIFISAHSTETLVRDDRMPAGSPHLQKPFSEEELLKKVAVVLADKSS